VLLFVGFRSDKTTAEVCEDIGVKKDLQQGADITISEITTMDGIRSRRRTRLLCVMYERCSILFTQFY
jgi:hypothetical protein